MAADRSRARAPPRFGVSARGMCCAPSQRASPCLRPELCVPGPRVRVCLRGAGKKAHPKLQEPDTATPYRFCIITVFDTNVCAFRVDSRSFAGRKVWHDMPCRWASGAVTEEPRGNGPSISSPVVDVVSWLRVGVFRARECRAADSFGVCTGTGAEPSIGKGAKTRIRSRRNFCECHQGPFHQLGPQEQQTDLPPQNPQLTPQPPPAATRLACFWGTSTQWRRRRHRLSLRH